MQIRLSRSEFVEFGPHCDDFDNWLFKASRSKSAIELKFDQSNVVVTLDADETHTEANARVAGIATHFSRHPLHAGARYVIPMLGEIMSLKLPANCIYALRIHERSIADFWARNLFYALSVNGDLKFTSDKSTVTDFQSKTANEFAVRYLWYLRSVYEDEAFAQKNILDKLPVALYFPVIKFENKTLQAGMEQIRDLNIQLSKDLGRTPMHEIERERLEECRSMVLKLLD
ncbi:MAG: hypothetical protein AAFN91_12420 [Pseudomonadota bacterium]